MTINEVIARYIELRDAKAIIARRHEEELAPFNDKMQRIEAWLLNEVNKTGGTSIKTPSGTAIKTNQTSVTMEDGQEFKRFFFGPVAETYGLDLENVINLARWEVADLRAGKCGVQEYIKQHKIQPPGVKVSSMATVSVRRV